MVAKNDITGDAIQSIPTSAYQSNYDAIFRKDKTAGNATDEAKQASNTEVLDSDK